MHDAAFSRLFISVRARVKHMQEPGLQLRRGDQPEQLGRRHLPQGLRCVSCELELGKRVSPANPGTNDKNESRWRMCAQQRQQGCSEFRARFFLHPPDCDAAVTAVSSARSSIPKVRAVHPRVLPPRISCGRLRSSPVNKHGLLAPALLAPLHFFAVRAHARRYQAVAFDAGGNHWQRGKTTKWCQCVQKHERGVQK